VSAEQTDAIILRTTAWSETSLIANIYTRDFGKLSVLAKGARRPKSPFEAALDLLSFSRVVFIAKSGDTLDILTEAKLQQRFRAGSRDLLRLYSGYYVAELLDRLTDKGDKQPEIFEIALATLQSLADLDIDVRPIVLRLELQMLRCVGQLPSLRQCAQCGVELDTSEETKQKNEWFIFGLIAGGVLCERCQPGSPQLVRIPREGRQTLERFSSNDWQDIDLTNYPTQHRAAIRGLMGKYLNVVLDRKLQLHSYLEELGR
jgi:DNA repair protein RecO (recombination protein O)